jgi:hypothetical protein
MKLLIDGDILVYSCGWFHDTTGYRVPASGSFFQYKKDAVEYCAEWGHDPETLVRVHEPSSLTNYLNGIDWMVTDIERKFRKNTGLEVDSTTLVLSPLEGNFREKEAVSLPYKGNRKESSRPFHFMEMRNRVVTNHAAMVAVGEEADDLLAYTALTDDSYVICSIDKDLLMIPGFHYNWKTDTFVNMSYEEGLLLFFRQLLTGDRVDNIEGIKGIGPKRAEKLIDSSMPRRRWNSHVIAEYRKQYPDNWEAKLQENMRLLWIRRKPDETIYFSPDTLFYTVNMPEPV